ncbi:MAG: replication initiator protein A [Clostridium perfringens]|nr:replication initiator protein A [Clostridium perfringens]
MCNFINKDNFKVSNFYRFPKALMSKRYDSLMLESKVAYSFLLDMVSLSIENDWVNEEGDVFVKIRRKELMKKLGIKGSQKMTKIMEELKSFGLVVEEKVGLGRCNKIFLYDLESFENQNSEDKNSNHDTFENQSTGFLKSKFKGFDFKKHNKTNINKTKNIKTNLTKTQSNQDSSKTFDFKNLKGKDSKLKTFENQNHEDIKKDFDDERVILNHKESKRLGLTHKDTKANGINNKKYDYDIETLDTARELLGWSVDYKDANTLLKEACGNLYVLDLAYEKMVSIKGKVRNIVGYLKTILCC